MVWLMAMGCPGDGGKWDTQRDTAAVGEELCPGSVSDDESAAGGQVFARDQETLTVTVDGGTSAYTSTLSLSSPTSVTIGDSRSGDSATLGPFDEGVELVFQITVQDTGAIWQSGPAERNPDGQVHARIVSAGDGVWYGGFEDLNNAGDSDYNDLCFQIEGELDLVNPHQ